MAVKYGKHSGGGAVQSASRNKSAKRGNAGKSLVKAPIKRSLKRKFGSTTMSQPRWQGAGHDGVRKGTKGGR